MSTFLQMLASLYKIDGRDFCKDGEYFIQFCLIWLTKCLALNFNDIIFFCNIVRMKS